MLNLRLTHQALLQQLTSRLAHDGGMSHGSGSEELLSKAPLRGVNREIDGDIFKRDRSHD